MPLCIFASIASSPGLPAAQTCGFMHAESGVALSTHPSYFLLAHEFPQPRGFDSLKIGNRAHSVFGPVAVVKAFHMLTRKCAARATIVVGIEILAVFDGTFFACFGFRVFIASTTRARIVSAHMRFADPAIDPARSNHHGFGVATHN